VVAVASGAGLAEESGTGAAGREGRGGRRGGISGL
jgi:hypothetical protein